MFDTHCHLNFKAFKKNVGEVIGRAREAGVDHFIVPGTDLETSKKAIEIAQQYKGVYAAIGIHPHHVFEFTKKAKFLSQVNSLLDSSSKPGISSTNLGIPDDGQKFPSSNIHFQKNLAFLINELEKLIIHPQVVAVGEIGLDKYQYTNTKYQNYEISQELVELQKKLLIEQIKLAGKYKKSVILHNREAIQDTLELITNYQLLITNNKIVFHCCEPDDRLLNFAIKHGIFIGVDGDVTYNIEKQNFVKKIPLELLVLETDSPYLLPEPLRSQKLFPNEPKNVKLIAEFIAHLRNEDIDLIKKITEINSKQLFSFST